MIIERKALEQHLRNACEWRIMECEYCKQLHPVDLNVHMNLFQGDSDQRFVTRIWLDYEKQNECE